MHLFQFQIKFFVKSRAVIILSSKLVSLSVKMTNTVFSKGFAGLPRFQYNLTTYIMMFKKQKN